MPSVDVKELFRRLDEIYERWTNPDTIKVGRKYTLQLKESVISGKVISNHCNEIEMKDIVATDSTGRVRRSWRAYVQKTAIISITPDIPSVKKEYSLHFKCGSHPEKIVLPKFPPNQEEDGYRTSMDGFKTNDRNWDKWLL